MAKPSKKPSPKKCAAIPRSFSMGEDVGKAGTVFKVLLGLHDEFGDDRVIDTPIAEAGLVGLGVGCSAYRLAPHCRYHVWRLRHPGNGPDRKPGRQTALHVRRSGHRAHHHPLHNGCGALLCRAAFAKLTRLARAHPRPQSCHSLHTRRRQGPLQNCC